MATKIEITEDIPPPVRKRYLAESGQGVPRHGEHAGRGVSGGRAVHAQRQEEAVSGH